MRLLAAALLVAASATAAAQTLNPTADSYVRSGTWANSNFGTSTGLFTQTSNNTNYDSYLKFDTTSVGGSGSVANAKFRIAASVSSGSIGMTLYSVSNTTWSETAITWNNKPARGSALASATVTGARFVYYELDVTSYLQSEKAAGRNVVSFALHNPSNSSQAIWMESRENTDKPQLVLTPNAAPTVSLASPANGATFTAPANVTLTASASDTDGTIQKVQFFHGGTNPIATVTAAPYTFNWTNVAAASYTLTAKATDNLNATTTSAPVNITVNAAVAQLFFIHTDHLNTPRLVADATGTTVWRWDQQEPFGVNVPDENPSGLGGFEFPMRFPGQYADKETNLHYSYLRDCYDPATGRFCEPDPIGTVLFGDLAFRTLGAIGLAQPKLADLLYSKGPRYNHPYSYVGGNPISFTDPLGLEVGTMEQRGYPSGPTDPNAKYRMCMSEELPKCPYGTVATCAAICAVTAPTGPGALGCAIGCSCTVGYSCYELTNMYCKGKAGL